VLSDTERLFEKHVVIKNSTDSTSRNANKGSITEMVWSYSFPRRTHFAIPALPTLSSVTISLYHFHALVEAMSLTVSFFSDSDFIHNPLCPRT
jgi:hypothetical protein